MGMATARLAAHHGYAVSIISLEAERDHTAGLIDEVTSLGGEAIFCAADESEETDIVSAYQAAVERFGPPTGVFHAAGMFTGALVRDLDFAAVSKLISINVTGLMICCREAARHVSALSGGHGGSIVNVSSMAGRSADDRGTASMQPQKAPSTSLPKGSQKRSRAKAFA